MLSLWPRTLYFIFQQKNGYPESITASSFDTETTSAAIINKTWTDIIGTRDTAKGPPSGSGQGGAGIKMEDQGLGGGGVRRRPKFFLEPSITEPRTLI
jgi:hypothetical protein